MVYFGATNPRHAARRRGEPAPCGALKPRPTENRRAAQLYRQPVWRDWSRRNLARRGAITLRGARDPRGDAV